jgi:hypothetical protein
MPSEKTASAVNILKGNLAAGWNLLEGSSADYTDLGVARRFGGAAAAYSLRDIGAMNGRVVKVRRDVGETSDPEEDFSASQVQSGALEDYINGKLEDTLPADVETAQGSYSLRKVKAGYTGNAVRIRRSSDDIEVNVAFDSDDKVSASSAITNIAEQGGEIGSTTATDLNGFLNETLTVGVAVEGGDGADRPDSFSNATNSSFTATVTEVAGGYFPYRTNLNDVIVVSFDIVLTGSASPSLTTSDGIDTVQNRSNSEVISSSGSYTKTLTCDQNNGTATHIRFADSDDGTFAVTNFRVVSHTHQAFVHTWYNQSGDGSNGATQATSTKQPKIASSGTLLDHLLFDGTDDFLADTSVTFEGAITLACLSEKAADGLYSVSAARQGATNRFFGIQEQSSASAFLPRNNTSGATVTTTASGNTRLTFARTNADTDQAVASMGKALSTGTNDYGNTPTASLINHFVIGALTTGSGGTPDLGTWNGKIFEAIGYQTDETDNKFKIESNINNYYGLYNDANEMATDWSDDPTAPYGSAFTSNGKDGYTIDYSAGVAGTRARWQFANNVPSGEVVYYSFNASVTSGTPAVILKQSNGTSNANSSSVAITNGFNSGSITTNAEAVYFAIGDTEGTQDYSISDFKVSRIARNGFVETWYDQSGNGRDMIQATAGNQPSIVSNGGYMGGVYSAPASNITTNSNKQYMRITGTNSFASNDLTTTKVGMVAIVNSLESGTASGVSIYTVLGNIRGVQSFPTGAIGLQISGTDNSQFTNYTATNAENKDESISTRTVGENTLIGGTMDNRNVKTFTFTEQGSDTDTTTASTDIVLTSQKDFGIFYSTFATDSGGEDLNVTRTAGGYMKEAYILDGDIIDDIDAINLELRQHYNLA